jgi:hypothetical protein
MEGCAIKRDASRFKPKEELEIADLPPFPLKAWLEEMTPQERQAAAGFYLAKIVDHLQGRKPDVWNRRTRPDIDSPRNSRIPETLQEQSLLSGAEEPDSSH